MVRTPAIVVVAILLSGCATASPAPAGLTPSERADFVAQEQDLQWLLADLPGEQPAVSATFVTSDSYPSLLNRCLADRGLGEAMVVAGGIVSLPEAPLTPEQRLALYLCSATYIVTPDETGYLSAEERARVYDYYRDWLVPCIEANGLQIPFVHSRDEFAATPGYVDWSPYYPIENGAPAARMGELQSRCPAYPPGLF